MATLVYAASVAGATTDRSEMTRIRDAGYGAIDVSIASLDRFTSLAGCGWLADLRTVGASHGLRVASVTVPMPPIALAEVGSDERAAVLACLDGMMRQLSGMGARWLIVRPPPVCADVDDAPPLVGYGEMLNSVHVAVGALWPTADRTGIVLAIESPHLGALLSPVELRELIDGIGGANVGACFPDRASSIARFADWSACLGPRLVAIRRDGGRAQREEALRRLPAATCLVCDALV